MKTLLKSLLLAVATCMLVPPSALLAPPVGTPLASKDIVIPAFNKNRHIAGHFACFVLLNLAQIAYNGMPSAPATKNPKKITFKQRLSLAGKHVKSFCKAMFSPKSYRQYGKELKSIFVAPKTKMVKKLSASQHVGAFLKRFGAFVATHKILSVGLAAQGVVGGGYTWHCYNQFTTKTKEKADAGARETAAAAAKKLEDEERIAREKAAKLKADQKARLAAAAQAKDTAEIAQITALMNGFDTAKATEHQIDLKIAALEALRATHTRHDIFGRTSAALTAAKKAAHQREEASAAAKAKADRAAHAHAATLRKQGKHAAEAPEGKTTRLLDNAATTAPRARTLDDLTQAQKDAYKPAEFVNTTALPTYNPRTATPPPPHDDGDDEGSGDDSADGDGTDGDSQQDDDGKGDDDSDPGSGSDTGSDNDVDGKDDRDSSGGNGGAAATATGNATPQPLAHGDHAGAGAVVHPQAAASANPLLHIAPTGGASASAAAGATVTGDDAVTVDEVHVTIPTNFVPIFACDFESTDVPVGTVTYGSAGENQAPVYFIKVASGIGAETWNELDPRTYQAAKKSTKHTTVTEQLASLKRQCEAYHRFGDVVPFDDVAGSSVDDICTNGTQWFVIANGTGKNTGKLVKRQLTNPAEIAAALQVQKEHAARPPRAVTPPPAATGSFNLFGFTVKKPW